MNDKNEMQDVSLRKNKMEKFDKRKIIFAIGGILLVGILIVGYFWYQGNSYVKTIDARTDADVVAISATSFGIVEDLIEEGKQVKKGDVIGILGSGSIKSPIDGDIVKNNVVNGQGVNQGQVVAYIADLDKIYISANIEETKINKIKVGQEVEIKIDAFKGEKFKGKVESIGTAANSIFSVIPTSSGNGSFTKITQLVPIKIEFESKQNLEILLGMNVEIKINVAK